MERLALVALASLGLLLSACTQARTKQQDKARPAASSLPLENSVAAAHAAAPSTGVPGGAAAVAPPGPLRFLAIGGGSVPENTEVSLEQDIELVGRVLPQPGLVLFAGGSASPSVRELDPEDNGDALMTALGAVFAPRAGRGSRYRVPRFAAERATLENVEAHLSRALAEPGAPLVVYVAAHGDQGSEAKGNAIGLWGGNALSVARLAELHEQHTRGLRLVATSCFSGGFAELAFAHADAKARRPAPVPRCGLFAGTWDRETSGCDPNPDRRQQQSYGLHFTHALAGTRADGTPLPPGAADYDHDGKIGLLDAHTWARIHAASFDVPTTTSERWLRRVEAGSAPIDKALLPEDAGVIDALGADLGLPSEQAVERRWSELDRRLAKLDDAIGKAEGALASRQSEQSTELLERWPVLDDPFHPHFAEMLRQDRGAIESALHASARARSSAEANERVQKLYDEAGPLEVEEARVSRLRRAYETLHRAAALMQRGGPAAKYYASLLECERAAP